MYILVVLAPITVFVVSEYYFGTAFVDGQYLFVGNIILVVILIILLLAYYLFDKSYLVIFFGCHQKVTRSFRINGKYFILCSRCSGILVGMLVSVVLTYLNVHYLILLFMGLPLIIDGLIQKYSSYRSNNNLRFITGLMFGPTVVVAFSFIQLLLLRFFIMLVSNFI